MAQQAFGRTQQRADDVHERAGLALKAVGWSLQASDKALGAFTCEWD